VRVLELASRYGYLFLLLASIAENTFLLGFVVPGDAAVLVGGALSASGQLEPFRLTLVVVAGTLLGANLSFWIGRRGGIPLVERSAARFSIEPKRMKQVEAYFASHGAKTIFIASFVSGLKNLIPAVAGASRMGAVRFFVYNAAGSAIRGAALVAIGYVFGASFPRAMRIFGEANVWILVVLIVAMAVLLVVRRRKQRRQALESGAEGQNRVDRGTP
jgi:membrane protein DedA with SNARE-associated domain